MLRRRPEQLPTTSAQLGVPDGSGKSIKMEDPIAKAVKSASGFTKGSYIWLLTSLLFMWTGWTWIWRSSASMILDCHANGCTLTIKPPYAFVGRNTNAKKMPKSKRKIKIEVNRDQLVRADNIKWDPAGQRIITNYGSNSPTYNNRMTEDEKPSDGEEPDQRPTKPWKNHKKGAYKKKYKKTPTYGSRTGGPDADGLYDSYVVVLRDPLPAESGGDGENDGGDNESPSKKMQRQMQAQHRSMTHDPNSLASLLGPFDLQDNTYRSRRNSDAQNSENMFLPTEYMIHMRDFNLGKTRRLARTAVSKINAYTKGRRSNFLLRESRPVVWQGLVLLILGIFSLVLCLLLGQFWEEADPTKDGSYRKRMAEIKKRNMQKRRNFGTKPLMRALNGSRLSGTSTGQVVGSARMRKNDNGGAGEGGRRGMGYGAAKRGY